MTKNQTRMLFRLSDLGKMDWLKTTGGETRTLDSLCGYGLAKFDMALREWYITDLGMKIANQFKGGNQ